MITEGDDVVGSSTNTAPETFGETPFGWNPASNGAECQPRRACAPRADHHESVAVALDVTSDTADVCVGASVGVACLPRWFGRLSATLEPGQESGGERRVVRVLVSSTFRDMHDPIVVVYFDQWRECNSLSPNPFNG